MRRLFPAAFAAVALTIVPVMAMADDDQEALDAAMAQPADSNTYFDLGVDVSNVAQSPAAVRGFLSGLEPETQRAVMSACDHFMEAPTTAQNPDTLAFCEKATNSG